MELSSTRGAHTKEIRTRTSTTRARRSVLMQTERLSLPGWLCSATFCCLAARESAMLLLGSSSVSLEAASTCRAAVMDDRTARMELMNRAVSSS